MAEGRRILPGFEDGYMQLFADSDSNASSGSSEEEEEENVYQQPVFQPDFRLEWTQGGVAPTVPRFTGKFTVELCKLTRCGLLLDGAEILGYSYNMQY